MQNSLLPNTVGKQQRAVTASSRLALSGMMAQVAVESGVDLGLTGCCDWFIRMLRKGSNGTS